MSNDTPKEFLVIGVSEHNGMFKVRYTNTLSRAKTLERNGHTNVTLIELPHAGTKEDCMNDLLNALGVGVSSQLTEPALEAIYAEARSLGFIV